MRDIETDSGDLADIVRREVRSSAVSHLLLYVPILALVLVIFIAGQSALVDLDAVHQHLNVVEARIVDVDKRITRIDMEQAKRGKDIERLLERSLPR